MPLRLTHLATGAIALFALTACSDTPAPTGAEAHALHGMSANARGGAEIGRTDGWADGKTVTFHYNKPFFCAPGSSSKDAATGCILGEEPRSAPRKGAIPVVYVAVPLGFDVAKSTLQCPEAGACINHPSTIDLSPVFGPGTEQAPLPPHSHVIGDEGAGNKGGWWEIEVVGITSPAAWDRLVAGKSLETLRAIQASSEGGATGDIPTNLFLFFSANPSGR